MANKKETLPRVSDQALEWVMHDVLDGLLELSLESALSDGSADFQIIEIAPETQPSCPSPGSNSADMPLQAKIIPFPSPRKSTSRRT